MPSDDRQLDFAGLLAELHALVDRPVLVESSAEGRRAFQAARGLLESSIDMQIDLPGSLAKPARISFFLDGEGMEASFSLHEDEFLEARAYSVPLQGGFEARHVQVLLAGGAELLVSEDFVPSGIGLEAHE